MAWNAASSFIAQQKGTPSFARRSASDTSFSFLCPAGDTSLGLFAGGAAGGVRRCFLRPAGDTSVGLFAGGAAGDVPRCFSIVDDSSIIGDSFIVDKIANMSLACAPHHREIRQKKGEKRGKNKREKKKAGEKGGKCAETREK
jgi:hypothetical protein